MKNILIVLSILLISFIPLKLFAAGNILEIEAGWGFPVLKERDCNNYLIYSSGINMNENFPIGDKFTTNSIFMRFYTNIAPKVDFGVGIAYERYWQKYKYRNMDRMYLSAVPMFKFKWRNKQKIQIYSGVGVGATLIEDFSLAPAYDEPTHWELTAHITFVGIKAGKRLYWFGELGAGAFGYINTGIGYRFSKNK